MFSLDINKIIALFVLVILPITVAVIWYLKVYIHRKNIFSQRENISENDFYLLFLTEVNKENGIYEKNDVIKVAEKIASHIHIPLAKLRPSDSIETLSAPEGWEYDDEVYDFYAVAPHLNRKSSTAEIIQAVLNQEKSEISEGYD